MKHTLVHVSTVQDAVTNPPVHAVLFTSSPNINKSPTPRERVQTSPLIQSRDPVWPATEFGIEYERAAKKLTKLPCRNDVRSQIEIVRAQREGRQPVTTKIIRQRRGEQLTALMHADSALCAVWKVAPTLEGSDCLPQAPLRSLQRKRSS